MKTIKTDEEFKKEIKKKNPSLSIKGKYKGAHERIEVKCNNCGFEWAPYAYSLSSGKGCPHCTAIISASKRKGRLKTKSNKDFVEEMNAINPSLRILSKYLNNQSYIEYECKTCGYIGKAKAYSLLQGHGCKRCAKSGTSFMEQCIYLSFRKVFGKEVLSRTKNIVGTELDIYIPSLQIAFEPGSWNFHKDRLKQDTEKRQMCEQKNIRLITIYDCYPCDLKKPFDEDCLVYTVDLNKSDHKIIKSLIERLFTICNYSINFTLEEWAEIEKTAYCNAKAKTNDDFIKQMKTIHPSIEVIGKYENSNKRISVRCKKCGYKWNAVPSNLLSGDGCKKCGRLLSADKERKSQKDFIKQVKIANPNIEVLGIYKGRHKKVKAKCKICGYTWEPIASSLLRGSNHKGSKKMHAAIISKTNISKI